MSRCVQTFDWYCTYIHNGNNTAAITVLCIVRETTTSCKLCMISFTADSITNYTLKWPGNVPQPLSVCVCVCVGRTCVLVPACLLVCVRVCLSLFVFVGV